MSNATAYLILAALSIVVVVSNALILMRFIKRLRKIEKWIRE
jgi:hypothetical protein